MSRYTASSATSSSTCNVLYSFCNRHVHTRSVPYREVRARARVYTPLFTHDRWRQTRKGRERERVGRMIAGGRGDDKKGEEAADALVCFLSLRCSPDETSVSARTRVCARGHACMRIVCADDRRTLPPLCVRLRTFAISLNPQTTSVRVGAI